MSEYFLIDTKMIVENNLKYRNLCTYPCFFLFIQFSLSCFQGLDEEAIVDHGKSSFTTNTNYEKEDLESKFKTIIFFLFS